ncbi:MAG TPA: MjaI family restriction endonuclease [archaeon]|nr:MjaI family restriction endonuclease [archaeon]
MKEELKITRKQLMRVAGYTPKIYPKYTASIINLLNRWARGTASKVVGQMSDLVQESPYKDYEKWKGWYLKKHPKAIEEATKLIMAKLREVGKAFQTIDENTVRMWVEDLVIDKSFWGLKIQETILQELEKITEKSCRQATKEEERKGIDGFVGGMAVQIKPSTYKNASNVKTEKLRAKTIYYEKNRDGDYVVDISEISD